MSSVAHRGFARQPALDGVRAIAVALVLLFHQGWLSGGYLGVSVFFTLSGYLITALALVEHDRTGRLDVRAFYGRRVRRLLPASLACLGGVVVLAVVGVFDAVGDLRRDLWGALTQLYNWVALGDGDSYADMVAGTDAARSPLDHYWSLAIEEQFYWVWPLVLVLVLRHRPRGRTVLIGAGTIAFALAAPAIAAIWGPDAAYWATPARLAEILAGALLAAVLHARAGRRLPRATGLLAPAGLLAIVVSSVVWPSGSGPAYRGWLPVFAAASVALIVGLQVPSPIRRVLSCRPLVVLGAISYGVYLFHWPVYLVLDEERTNLPTVPLFALRLAATVALAVVSFRHLESPVRRGRPRRLVVPIGAVTACALVAVAVVLVPSPATPYWMTADAAAPSSAMPADTAPLAVTTPAVPITTSAPTKTTTTTGTTTTTIAPDVARGVSGDSGTAPPETTGVSVATPTPAPAPASVAPPLPAAPARPVRVLVVGDSTAMATAKGLEAWEDDHPDHADFISMADPGCGFIPDGRQQQDRDGRFADRCRDVREEISDNLSWLLPDVVLGMVTISDLDQRLWDDAEGWLGPADPLFFERLVAAYDTASTELLAAGATDVLWVAPPVPEVPYGPDEQHLLDPARYARFADALHEVAVRHPGQVAVVDLPAWLATQPAAAERPDGLHWSTAASRQIAEELLAPVIVTAALT